jgi:hypothetical protein
MRAPALLCLTAAALLGPSLPAARAQLLITDVQVGFKPNEGEGAEGAGYKPGFWTPVYVTVKGGDKGFSGGTLIVETSDSDDVQNRYKQRLNPLDPGQEVRLTTYTKPGSGGAEIIVSAQDRQGRTYLPPDAKKTYVAGGLGQQLYLTLGFRSQDLGQALKALGKHLNQPHREARARSACYLDRVADLPTRWYGYDAVDLLFLPSGNATFLTQLLGDKQNRWQALGEWVRRGGRLLISVSENRALVVELFKSWKPAPPPVLGGREVEVKGLDSLRQFAEVQDKPFDFGPGSPKLRLARLDIRGPAAGPVEVLATENPNPALVVRVPYGLGSITFLAIDLDRGPIPAWEGRQDLWKKLVTRLEPNSTQPADEDRGGKGMREENDIATDLQWELEQFMDVHPVSFGWVAFFIFLYILVVGPLDYLFLKKVVKRLEWTWITFPAVVIVVSVAAYFTAYGLKGKDLKVNKVDVIDVDQLTPQAHAQGTTWFTLYSPRIQSYTVGIEPAPPAWGAGAGQFRQGPVVLSWMGRPEDRGFNSYGRQRSQRLFQGKYDFADNASGVTGVPLPFAGTKTFTASWESPLPPVVAPQLFYEPNNPDRISGTVKNLLPVELEEAAIFYGGKWHRFAGALSSKQKVELKNEIPPNFNEWAAPLVSRTHYDARQFDPGPVVKHILFHERLNTGGERRDNSLTRLDQSWRLREPTEREVLTKEAVLYARLPRLQGPAEEVSGKPSCPSKLWLGELPASGQERPALAGSMIQDTYIRVYLPVLPRKE